MFQIEKMTVAGDNVECLGYESTADKHIIIRIAGNQRAAMKGWRKFKHEDVFYHIRRQFFQG